jgi:hypothetical protein
MKLEFLALACVAAGLVAGCKPGNDAAVDATQPSAEQVAEAPKPPVPACLRGKGYDQLPSGVCLHQQFGFQSVRHYQDKQGNDRTRVTFAYEHGIEGVVATITDALTDKGYRARERENKANGSILLPFTKRQAGTTYLEIKPDPDGVAPGSGKFFIDYRDVPAVPASSAAG